MHELIPSAVNLAILIGLMVYFLREPMANFVKNRHLSLAEELSAVREKLQQAKAQFQDFSSKLSTVESEISGLHQQTRQEAAQTQARVLANAQKISGTIVTDAKASTEGLYAEFRNQLIHEFGAQVLDRAEQIIRERLTGDDRVRIRQEFSKQVESVG